MKRITRPVITLCVLLAIAGLGVVPAAIASGDGEPADSDKAAAQPAATVVAAEAAVEADPSIAAVLAGKDAAVDATP